MKREFVEADITPVRAERVRIGTERENARAVVEFDVAYFEVFSEAGVFAVFEDWHFPGIDAVGEDRSGAGCRAGRTGSRW